MSEVTGTSSSSDNGGLKKGPWTAEEDRKLVDYINKFGHGRWRTLPNNAGLKRCGKSCRLRWQNYLRPDIKRGRFSSEEEETIIQLHSILGNKWSAIAARLPGRTDNEIKNYWNTHIKKKLLRMGIDPVTHAPKVDLPELSTILSSSLYNYTHYQNLPNLLGLIGSTTLDQSKDFLDLAKQLMISQNIPRETTPSYLGALLANQLQHQKPSTSSNPSFIGGQYYSFPSSWAENDYGAFNQSMNNLLGADQSSVYSGVHNNNLGSMQSFIDPNSVEEIPRWSASSGVSSPTMSNSNCSTDQAVFYDNVWSEWELQ